MGSSRHICKDTLRAADIDGSMVSYGRMTPDMHRFNPFWWKHEADPYTAVAKWVGHGVLPTTAA